MNKKDLYDYIDDRLKDLTKEENDARDKFAFDTAVNCVSKKNELLDIKLFIQSL